MSWVKNYIRTIPDVPKSGILYRDVTTLFENEIAFSKLIDTFVSRYSDKGINKVACIEARGFIHGGALAYRLGAGFVTLRKPGKLPFLKDTESYELEYGSSSLELHIGSINKGDNVLIVDDLIATGGTAIAAYNLIHRAGGSPSESCFIIDLAELGGSKLLEGRGCNVYALAKY